LHFPRPKNLLFNGFILSYASCSLQLIVFFLGELGAGIDEEFRNDDRGGSGVSDVDNKCHFIYTPQKKEKGTVR
jgi:hypothetical protein